MESTKRLTIKLKVVKKFSHEKVKVKPGTGENHQVTLFCFLAFLGLLGYCFPFKILK